MEDSCQCPTCGVALPPHVPGGICPACALRSAMADEASELDDIRPGQLETGSVVDRYEILGGLGRGGSGEVYLAAQQGEVSRKVALKVLYAAAESDQMVARFESERDALMRMEHPGIAGVVDAGFLEDGRPFVALEHVDGEALDVYLAGNTLTLNQKLQLFLSICAAVSHAHGKAVLHRDLKPSNILVTEVDGEPVPKLIDFGIARTMDRDEDLAGLFTRHSEVIGTPNYMSPEQTLGGSADIDVRSDIYTLGALLYEMLVGRPLFASSEFEGLTIDDVFRRIRLAEAPRPSAGVAGIDRDLDAVTLKCLAKEPERRYQNVEGLVTDLERFLNHEPVTATTPTAIYKFGKFVRRNRHSVIAGVALLTAMIVGAGVSLFQAKLARERLEASEKLIGHMVGDLAKQLRSVGKLEAMAGTAQEVEAFYAELGTKGRSETSLVREASALRELGRVSSAQGQPDEAVRTFERAVDILDGVRARNPQNEEALDLLSRLWESTGAHHVRQQEFDAADAALAKATAIAQEGAERFPENPEWRNAVAAVLVNRSASAVDRKDWERGLALAEEGLRGEVSPTMRALLLQNKGNAMHRSGKQQEALEPFNEAIKTQEILVEEDPENTVELQRLAGIAQTTSGTLYELGNRTDELITMNRKIIEIRSKLLSIEPDNTYWRDLLAQAHWNLALALGPTGDKAAQKDAVRAALSVREPLVFTASQEPRFAQRYVQDFQYLMSLLAKDNSWREVYHRLVQMMAYIPDTKEPTLWLGRAAAYRSKSAGSAGEAEKAADYLALANWVIETTSADEESLRKAAWPFEQLDGLGQAADQEQLRSAVESRRIAMPPAWRDQILQ